MDRLSRIVSGYPDVISAQTLVELLADLEPAAAIQFSDTDVAGDLSLLSEYYSVYLLSLMLADDLNEARFLVQRFPPTLSVTDQTLINSKNLVRAVWLRKYDLTYQILHSSPWPAHIQPLVSRYIEHFRTTAFQLLSRAYTRLTPTLANDYLGFMPPSEEVSMDGTDTSHESLIVEKLQSRGWKWDDSEQSLLPVDSANGSRGNETNGIPNGDSMASLVELVGFLGE